MESRQGSRFTLEKSSFGFSFWEIVFDLIWGFSDQSHCCSGSVVECLFTGTFRVRFPPPWLFWARSNVPFLGCPCQKWPKRGWKFVKTGPGNQMRNRSAIIWSPQNSNKKSFTPPLPARTKSSSLSASKLQGLVCTNKWIMTIKVDT